MKNAAKVMAGIILAASIMAITPPAFGQAQLVKRLIEDGVELIFKQATKESAKELSELGGEVVVRQVLKKAAEEGGEAAVKRVTAYGLEHGAIALRVISRSPLKMVEALDGLAAEIRPVALRAVERNPLLLTKLTEQFGKDALEAAIRHPGIGEIIAQALGHEGIAATKDLTTDQAIIIARHADEIAKLPDVQRAGVFKRIATGAAEAMDCLEKHPRVLYTTATVLLFIDAKDDLIGRGSIEEETNGASTIRRTTPPGLFHRLGSDVAAWIAKPFGIAVTALLGLLGAWAVLKLWSIWHRCRAEVKVAEARAQAAINALSPPAAMNAVGAKSAAGRPISS